jgi:hypothetical protein
VLLAAFALGGDPGVAQTQPAGVMAATESAPLIRVQARRARPKIRVRPRYRYRNYHSAYPLPYDNEYPGPNAVRQCTDWYATEHRPSGTVIVPKRRCWWVQ